MEILTILFLLIIAHRISFHLCFPSLSLSVFYSFQWADLSLAILGKSIPNFYPFSCYYKWNCFINFLFGCSLFCKRIYLETLSNSVISSNRFGVCRIFFKKKHTLMQWTHFSFQFKCFGLYFLLLKKESIWSFIMHNI